MDNWGYATSVRFVTNRRYRVNLGEVERLLALELAGDVMAAVLAVVEPAVPARRVVRHELRHRAELDVVGRRVERHDRQPVLLVAGHRSVFHARVPAVGQNLHMSSSIRQQRAYSLECCC
jgi:hypothetical protein